MRAKPSHKDYAAFGVCLRHPAGKLERGASSQQLWGPTDRGATQTPQSVQDSSAAQLPIGVPTIEPADITYSRPNGSDRLAPDTDVIFVKPREARRLLGLGKTKYHEICNQGLLTRVYEGRMVRVTMASIRVYAEHVVRRSINAPSIESRPLRKHGAVRAQLQQGVATERSVAASAEPTKVSAAGGAATGSPSAQPATQSSDFDPSWLTLAGVATEQL